MYDVQVLQIVNGKLKPESVGCFFFKFKLFNDVESLMIMIILSLPLQCVVEIQNVQVYHVHIILLIQSNYYMPCSYRKPGGRLAKLLRILKRNRKWQISTPTWS